MRLHKFFKDVSLCRLVSVSIAKVNLFSYKASVDHVCVVVHATCRKSGKCILQLKATGGMLQY